MSSWLGHAKKTDAGQGLNAVDEELVLEVGSRNSCSAVVDSGGAACTLTYAFEISCDGGDNYEPWLAFGVDATPAPVSTVASAAGTIASTAYYIPLPGGATHVRVRLSAYTSGVLNVGLRAIDTVPGHVLATLVDSSGNVGSGLSLGAVTTDIKLAEDATHANGDAGVQQLQVRKDAPAGTASAENKYGAATQDGAGAGWVRGRNPNNLASGQVATSVTSAELVPARAQRANVTIKNLDATITIWVGPGTVTTANGFELKAGESKTYVTTSAINGRSASGTPTLGYDEEYFS